MAASSRLDRAGFERLLSGTDSAGALIFWARIVLVLSIIVCLHFLHSLGANKRCTLTGYPNRRKIIKRLNKPFALVRLDGSVKPLGPYQFRAAPIRLRFGRRVDFFRPELS